MMLRRQDGSLVIIGNPIEQMYHLVGQKNSIENFIFLCQIAYCWDSATSFINLNAIKLILASAQTCVTRFLHFFVSNLFALIDIHDRYSGVCFFLHPISLRTT